MIKFLQTVRYFKLKQVYYQCYYRLKAVLKIGNYNSARDLNEPFQSIIWEDFVLSENSLLSTNTFEFLNIRHSFSEKFDWNLNDYGKLWTYNLNYFDYLNQEEISLNDGLFLIQKFIAENDSLKDGKEPYPISLRGINWIKFLSKHSIVDYDINKALFGHYQILFHNLEYHLLGNHLLENGFSLFFGAYFFKDEVLYKKAIKILKEELNEQILKDGAHFELSPMYHQIVLYRLMECINLSHHNKWKEDGIELFLRQKASKMLSWLEETTFSNGNIPMVNDSAYGIAPTSRQIFDYAEKLKLNWTKGQLTDSGYRKFFRSKYEFFLDVGNVGPDYQPGHAHSDTFNFEMYVSGRPVIVDTGISTYEKNRLRRQERGTVSHNTVQVGNQDQTQVWGGFRVAKRARIVSLEEGPDYVKATHNGYSNLGIEHTRSFTFEPSRVIINDELNKNTMQKQSAFFHFHPSVKKIDLNQNLVELCNENITIKFDGAIGIEIGKYNFCKGFNLREKSLKIIVSFQRNLNAQIEV
ncbi:alginate lyase family protein [Flagellimonas allohymeniacidonis]|uniref:Alginate lyase family protein n=1 Tax=Flagellimonas allohymeniacidonis TaxID=2517819 RepID=A0A4Q8QB33_9FLAO|nr:alginate lyase family protein [Allomuricauda hymeniacidonis]TAI47535.1 alginate lyase family protein [Allomuricauda hymeniacidonis]